MIGRAGIGGVAAGMEAQDGAGRPELLPAPGMEESALDPVERILLESVCQQQGWIRVHGKRGQWVRRKGKGRGGG